MAGLWAIRVTYPSGQDAYLRHGPTPGEGSFVRFPTKHRAETFIESHVRPGLDEGAIVAAVRSGDLADWKEAVS